MERLLCIKIASRGDLLLSAPTFRMLRESRPHSHITLLVGATCEDVARHLPYFDAIHIVDDKALMAGSVWSSLKEAVHLYHLMKSSDRKVLTKSQDGDYSEVFIFHRDWRYNLLAWLAGIPIRRGFYTSKGSCFLTHPYRAGNREHHIHQYLGMAVEPYGQEPVASMVSAKPRRSSSPPPSDLLRRRVNSDQHKQGNGLGSLWQFIEGEREKALKLAANEGFKPEMGKWVALGFGGGRNVKTQTDLKTWPIEHYRQLAARLAGEGYQIVWIGDAEDAKKLGNHSMGVNLAGKLSVSDTAVILSMCEFVVANDTLILHLAEALKIRTVGIFGPTDPFHYRPLGKLSRYVWFGDQLSCSPCHQDGYFPPCKFDHRCMKELTVDSVLTAIKGASEKL